MARYLEVAAAVAVLASLAWLAALPAVTASSAYYRIQVGLLAVVETPAGSSAQLYAPMLVPEALLAASAAYIIAGRRARAAYLALAALSYYMTASLELARALGGASGLAMPFGPSSTLVVPGASVRVDYASVAALTASSGASLAASTWREVSRLVARAEELARRRFGVSLGRLRGRSPGLAEAVETYSRFAPGHGESSRSYLFAAAAGRRGDLRGAADEEARRRFGVGIEELERTRPWAARELMRYARYMPRDRGGGRPSGS